LIGVGLAVTADGFPAGPVVRPATILLGIGAGLYFHYGRSPLASIFPFVGPLASDFFVSAAQKRSTTPGPSLINIY
jgi:hypothetical protein